MIDGRCKRDSHMNEADRRYFEALRTLGEQDSCVCREDVPAVNQAMFEEQKIKYNLQLKPGYMRKSRKISIRP